MILFKRAVLLACVPMTLFGCAAVPPFVLNADVEQPAPTGPKVAAVVAHIKCELLDVARSDAVLPYYRDDPALTLRMHAPEEGRTFTLRHLFEEIEYVAEAELTLDVTGSGGLAPSLSFIRPYTSATSLTGIVGGGFSEATHRSINLYTSVDFNRLVESPMNPRYAGVGHLNHDPAVVKAPSLPCDATSRQAGSEVVAGAELGGDLGLYDAIASSFIGISMNDVGVLPVGQKAGAAGKDASANGKGVAAQLGDNYTFGLFGTQIDFTINESVSGGPSYALSHFKGPSGTVGGTSASGGGGPGLIGFSRQVKDTLTISFVPVCVRQKYYAPLKGPPYEYMPKLIDGTPAWTDFLPPCPYLKDQTASARNALAKARENNQLLQNQSILDRIPFLLH